MSRNRPLISLAVALGLAALVASGCGTDHGAASPTSTTNLSNSSGSGLLSVQLATAGTGSVLCFPDSAGHGGPPDTTKKILSLNLTFDTVRVYPARADSDSLAPCGGHGPRGHGDPDSAAAYIELLTSPISVDAMELGDTLTSILANATLPSGRYSHLALHIAAASAVTNDSAQVTVSVAGRDSLVRVLTPFTVAEGQTTEVRITINLLRAVRELPPGSGTYVLAPVLAGRGRGPHGGPPEGGGGGHHGPGGPPGHGGPGGGHGRS